MYFALVVVAYLVSTFVRDIKLHLLLLDLSLNFFYFSSHLHCLVSCHRSGPHSANTSVDVNNYHLSSTMLVKQKLDLTLRNLHITLTSQVESITILCFAVHLEARGRQTHATTNVKEFTHFPFELI